MKINKLPWLLIATTALIALAFVYRRGQDQNWDLLNYHYFSGYAFLHGRFFTDIAPSHLQSFFNPLPNTLAYAALSLLAFPASAWALAGVQLLSLPLLVLICREISRDLGHDTPSTDEALALLLCVLAPLWWSELGTTFYSSTTAPIVLLGVLQGIRGVARAGGPQPADGTLAFAGLSFGLATGLKLTNAVFAVGFLFALVPALLPRSTKLALHCWLVFAASLVVGFACTAWWYIFLIHRWGNPFFPFYNALFKSPYFDLMNFYDLRWKFNSLFEFLYFLPAAVRGTAKTSEIPFADARLLIFTALLVPALVSKYFSTVKIRSFSLGRNVTKVFLWFFGISFTIWALFFAYQRYVIPLELLFGVAIWILLAQIFRERNLVAAVLAVCVLASLATLSIPDWGHKSVAKIQANVFGLQLPADLTNSPADYLVYSTPISYIFPFLHPESRFFCLGFSPGIDGLIKRALSQNTTRPVRMLTRESVAGGAMAELARFGYLPRDNASCSYFRSDVGSYVVCEVQARSRD